MTRSSFDREIGDIIRLSGEMGGVAEEMVRLSIPALISRDLDLAQQVIDMDRRVDAGTEAVDAAVFKAMALRQPQAVDLRQMLTLLQAASSIERIADHAKGVARFVQKSRRYSPTLADRGWEDLGRLALTAVQGAISALCQRDAGQARLVWQGDAAIDALCDRLCEQIMVAAELEPRIVRQATQFVLSARLYERIGDQATNIAEHVIFLVEGHPPQGERPRG